MKKHSLRRDGKEPAEEIKTPGWQAANTPQTVQRSLALTPFSQKLLSENALSLQAAGAGIVPGKNHSQGVDQAGTGEEPGQKSKIRFAGFLRAKNTRNIAAVFVGLVLAVFLLKKMVDGVVEKTFPAPQKAAVISALRAKEKMSGEEYQNALVTAIVPPEAKVKTQLPKPARIQDIRKQVSLRGSDYTVGYFGGISGLKLTVSNRSKHFINQVELEINYLKRNGDIIETDTYQIPAVKPRSSQTLCVPPVREGVKVRYRIVYIYARQYPPLKEI